MIQVKMNELTNSRKRSLNKRRSSHRSCRSPDGLKLTLLLIKLFRLGASCRTISTQIKIRVNTKIGRKNNIPNSACSRVKPFLPKNPQKAHFNNQQTPQAVNWSRRKAGRSRLTLLSSTLKIHVSGLDHTWTSIINCNFKRTEKATRNSKVIKIRQKMKSMTKRPLNWRRTNIPLSNPSSWARNLPLTKHMAHSYSGCTRA